jgi:hypothetical protein
LGSDRDLSVEVTLVYTTTTASTTVPGTLETANPFIDTEKFNQLKTLAAAARSSFYILPTEPSE